MTEVGRVRTAGLGDDHSCVVTPDDKTRCIGLNDEAQLGNGSKDVAPDGGDPPAHTTFTLVSGLPPAERVFAHGNHACAILAHPCPAAGGRVMCWGTNVAGEAGNGTKSATPVPVVVRAP